MFVNKTSSSWNARSARDTTSVALPNTLAQSAYETKYVGLFWETYLPGSWALSASTVQGQLEGWVKVVGELYVSNVILKKALLAICLRMAARNSGEKWMGEKGFELYADALKQMSVALSVPSRAKSNELFAASKIFSLYEVRHKPY